jgi:AraC family transcriptional activator FtrA
VNIVPNPKPLVVILAYDELCSFEYGCALEVFALPRPEAGERWYRCRIAAAEPGPLRGFGGVEVRADGGLELLEQADTIVLPGWRWRGQRPAAPQALLESLRLAHARGARLVAICAGAFVFAAAGLLSGRRATTHWHHVGQLKTLHPDIEVLSEVLYVDEGSILTSAGSAAGLDLCLHLVRRDFGARTANLVARRLVLGLHREADQSQYLDRPVRSEGSRLAPLLERVQADLSGDWTIERLADEAGVSVRGIHRHVREATGMAPGEWLLAVRIARSRELLEDTTLSVEAVARAVGFIDAATLRYHFKRVLNTSPSSYRACLDQRAVRRAGFTSPQAIATEA